MKSLFGKDPAKEMRYTYLLEDACGPLAYVIFKPEEGEDGKIGNVRELAFAKPEGPAQAFGFAHRLGAQAEGRRRSLAAAAPRGAARAARRGGRRRPPRAEGRFQRRAAPLRGAQSR